MESLLKLEVVILRSICRFNAARPAELCTMISGCGFTIQKSRKLFREIVQHPLNAKILVLENKELYGIPNVALYKISIKNYTYLYIIVFAHGTVTNDDDRVSRSKGWANWTKLTPINTFGGTS